MRPPPKKVLPDRPSGAPSPVAAAAETKSIPITASRQLPPATWPAGVETVNRESRAAAPTRSVNRHALPYRPAHPGPPFSVAGDQFADGEIVAREPADGQTADDLAKRHAPPPPAAACVTPEARQAPEASRQQPRPGHPIANAQARDRGARELRCVSARTRTAHGSGRLRSCRSQDCSGRRAWQAAPDPLAGERRDAARFSPATAARRQLDRHGRGGCDRARRSDWRRGNGRHFGIAGCAGVRAWRSCRQHDAHRSFR